MKRSEMRTQIAEVLNAHISSNKKTAWDDEQVREFSKNLLDRLEALGMKAPERVFWNRHADGRLSPHQKNGEMVNEWDSE
jgi:hypothetical protein